MRCVWVFGIMGILAGTASAEEGGPRVSADVVYTRFLPGRLGGINGFGADVFPGYELGYGVTPEIQLGYYLNLRSKDSVNQISSLRRTTLPFMIGLRVRPDLGLPLRVYVGAHVGGVYRREEHVWGVDKSRTDPGFNVGAGGEMKVSDTLSAGVDVWYWMVPDFQGGVEAEKLLTAGLTLSLSI